MEERHGKMASTTSGGKRRKTTSTRASYVNVNRQKNGYKDKYKKDVEAALKKFKAGIGKSSEDQLSSSEWKRFFKTVLIPLDGESERKMISLFQYLLTLEVLAVARVAQSEVLAWQLTQLQRKWILHRLVTE